MEFTIHKIGNRTIAELKANHRLNSHSDFLDLIGNASYQNAFEVIIYKSQIISDFFSLKTGFAGEVLQKFSTYDMRLAIIGDFIKVTSKSLNDFIRESNRMGRINFLATKEEFLR